jgi:hypothetical protein
VRIFNSGLTPRSDAVRPATPTASRARRGRRGAPATGSSDQT